MQYDTQIQDRLAPILQVMKDRVKQGEQPVLAVINSRPDIQLVQVTLFESQAQFGTFNPSVPSKRGEHFVVRFSVFDVPAHAVFEWLQTNLSAHVGKGWDLRYLEHPEP